MKNGINCILCILLLLCTKSANAQFLTYQDSIAKYYELKYKAELFIVDSSYQNALSLYNQAFLFKRPHEKDLYNSFILTCILHDSTYGKKYFDLLTFLGIPKNSLSSDLEQDGLDTLFLNKISADYERIHAASLKTGYRNNARVMDSFYRYDQGVREFAVNTYGQTEGYKKFNDSIERTDSINVDRMVQYIKKFGYPDIYKTGFYADNYRHISSYPVFFLIMHHTTAMPLNRGKKRELMRLAKVAVLNGQLDPRDFAMIYDLGEGMNKYHTAFQFIDTNGVRIYESIPVNQLSEINKDRASIYLDSVDDYCRKLEFTRRCYYFHFFNIHLQAQNLAFYNPGANGSR